MTLGEFRDLATTNGETFHGPEIVYLMMSWVYWENGNKIPAFERAYARHAIKMRSKRPYRSLTPQQ